MIFYYHFLLFEWFSQLCAIPCLAFVFYRFWYCKPACGWENVFVREKYSSYYDALNVFNLDHTRAVKSHQEKKGTIILQGDKYDSWYRIYLAVGAFHYTFDCFVKIYYYGSAVLWQDCKLVYFAHHLLTLWKFKSLWMLDTFTWFMAFPTAYHTLMVGKSHPINTTIYGLSIVCYVVNQLRFPNFRNNKVHRSLLVKTALILIPILCMPFMSCRVQWDRKEMMVADI